MSAKQLLKLIGLTVWALLGPLACLFLLNFVAPPETLSNGFFVGYVWLAVAVCFGGLFACFLRISALQRVIVFVFYVALGSIFYPCFLVILACKMGNCI